jgi:Transposase domain (DUF772)/Transposase DDE domain
MHLAWRWFTGLGFDQEIPHHSTFSKNRHGRFQESKLFEQLFQEIVVRCLEVGLVQGDNLSVDGSFVEANASKESRVPRKQFVEAAQVNQTLRQYLVELEQQNPTEEPVHAQEQASTTDPDATYATKGGTPARLGYYDNYLVDNRSCVIVGVQATAARMSQETVAAQDMIARFAQWQRRDPESVVADATYGNGKFLQWLMERGSHRICARGTVLCARTIHSTVPTVLRIFPKATATSVPPASRVNERFRDFSPTMRSPHAICTNFRGITRLTRLSLQLASNHLGGELLARELTAVAAVREVNR